MKFLTWIKDNIFFIGTLFLLAFIPLYPKRPLLDVHHTWVYVRIEDFVVAIIVFLWIIFFLLKKVKLKTPLTLPIILFWIVGGISTLHGVLLIFPTIADVFSNVAFLSFLRRIEYMSLFFVAFSAIKDKKFISYIAFVLAIVLLLVIGYGIGQKFYGLPAYLTMNEEFAKGIPIQLSELSRVPSTFAGHYDLAAYLVLIIPLLTSVAFGFKNLFLKILLLTATSLGFVLLFMTVSRVSFLVLAVSMVVLLILLKKKWLLISLFVMTFVLLSFFPSLLQRFGSTISEVNVLVDAKTGVAIGQVREVPAKYFEDKIIIRQAVLDGSTPEASSSAVLPYSLIPAYAALVIEPNAPTGEDLPQGTGYINLPLSPVTKKVNEYFYERPAKENKDFKEARMVHGDFLIKRAKAYDLSFTTRFQGEWPKTIKAFQRNILLGSGYSSVTLAVDNNYLRILGESGLLGFITFLLIFLVTGVYIKKVLPSVDSPVVRNFVLGFIAGTVGLALNAILIDVFEASKIAFTYWLLMGVTLGTLSLYQAGEINLYRELKRAASSTYAIIIYLLIITVVLFSPAYNYYFVGDDFTWFRWVSECSDGIIHRNPIKTAISYFTESNGFFYRPGTKLYFWLMYSTFWLNQTIYHLVSISLHFFITVALFFLSKRILKNHLLAAISAILFLTLSGRLEAVFWVSSTGFLFNAFFALLSLLFFIFWKEKKRIIYLVGSLVFIIFGLMFHELGIVIPLLLILYDIVFDKEFSLAGLLKKTYYLVIFAPIFPYLILRYLAQSHWFSGDYSYNLLKLPWNIVGNTIGYLNLNLFGPLSLPLYEALRSFSRSNMAIAVFVSVVLVVLLFMTGRAVFRNMKKEEQKIIIFGFLFFIISLLPFLGLGNITSRYSYLSSAGFVILLMPLLKRAFNYVIDLSDRYIGASIIAVVVIIFSMTHLFQLQKIHTDWYTAGEKVESFLVSLNEIYEDYWTKERMKFYFVNVPIKHGDAWVFPVGLKDAVWFVYRNKNIEVYQQQSLSEAFNILVDPINEKAFEFSDNGSVMEKLKIERKVDVK